MVRAFLAATLVALASSSPSGHAATEAIRVTGMFSDMHSIPETGDVLGMEVLIVAGVTTLSPTADFFVYFQDAVGVPKPPVVVPAKVDGTVVEFQLPGTLGTFHGRVEKTGLVGKFSGSQTTVRLPRRKSYWQ